MTPVDRYDWCALKFGHDSFYNESAELRCTLPTSQPPASVKDGHTGHTSSHKEGETMAEETWEDFGFRFGPFEFGVSGLGQFTKHTRTETSHIIRIRIDPAVKKEEIKARLVRPGLLEIEWPRSKGEEIPVE
jgi:hypothetical protein